MIVDGSTGSLRIASEFDALARRIRKPRIKLLDRVRCQSHIITFANFDSSITASFVQDPLSKTSECYDTKHCRGSAHHLTAILSGPMECLQPQIRSSSRPTAWKLVVDAKLRERESRQGIGTVLERVGRFVA